MSALSSNSSSTAPIPLQLPEDAAEWKPFVERFGDEGLTRARDVIARLKDGAARTTDEVLDLWNESDIALGAVSALTSVLSEVHPEVQVREAAEQRLQAAIGLETERSLDRGLWAVVDATDPAGLDATSSRFREHVLRDFRRSGVHLPDGVRATLKSLADRCTELGLEFSRNIREDKRSISVKPEALDGLPADFLESHAPGEDGLVRVSTEYPDLFPVRTFAHDPAVRKAITEEFLNIGYPVNEGVLRELLELRDERAHLLGYQDWPTYDAEVKMIGSGEAIAQFIGRLDISTAETSANDVAALLARLREDDASATEVTTADSLYYFEAIRREQFDVDAQAVRIYFTFAKVRDGLLAVTAEVFGIEYRKVDAPVWSDDVDAYDVYDVAAGSADDASGPLLGRIYLDLHPRTGKFNHAAQFTLTTGVTGRIVPEGVLVCNLPTGTMEHDDVVTLFHEFGHLIHHIVGGHHRFAAFSGVATEWDFVEAPSQMFEEWAWNADVLRRFAADEDGTPIPEALVEKMRRADAFGRGAWTRRQLNFTALSYRLHANPPKSLDAAQDAVDSQFGPYAPLPGTHQYAGFGHLEGYSSAYYTYLWSLVIAKDLFTEFGSDLTDPVVGRRYRDSILVPGGSQDAAVLVEGFLGRPYSFDAFERWLAEAPDAKPED